MIQGHAPRLERLSFDPETAIDPYSNLSWDKAGGKPVVSTDIPEMDRMPLVYSSKTPEEFADNLDRAVGKIPDLREIDCFLGDHTWAKRFDVIEKAIAELSFKPSVCRG